MKITGNPPTGESILKTLIELFETQEKIKITYEEDNNKKEVVNS